MTGKTSKSTFKLVRHSVKALAVPVTFLILFVSMLGVISITYYFAIQRVDANSQSIKVSMAKQNMNSLDQDLLSVLWQPGSSRTLDFSDCDGQLDVQPSSNQLVINVTDNNGLAANIFNSSLGEVVYELPYSESADTGLYLMGDSRSVVNQTASTLNQLYIRSGANHPEVVIHFRVTVSSTTEIVNNQAINYVKLYIVNMNSSQNMQFGGEIPLQISCTNVESTELTYNASNSSISLVMTAMLDGTPGQVVIPISTDTSGAVINIQVVVCDITIERWLR